MNVELVRQFVSLVEMAARISKSFDRISRRLSHSRPQGWHTRMLQFVYALKISHSVVLSSSRLANPRDTDSQVFIDESVCAEFSCGKYENEQGDCRELAEIWISAMELAPNYKLKCPSIV